ncbi:uracil-DNA glycosylase family protein [Subsaximicrobium wynnwilliamsii]|uniref:Uracil-DNA glycosylase family protein n=1 Tax=Subsaximicrobium wynnwilliamsii TaxID=291179 RepID=A0A5C6ZH40_9FLAO|nr:uracil-DNA glycosylase family protein [Subsaximicrobium wynnwilliamsii]TXD82786.1 uracil-DNA glycosylase family protein [Subsaximicrobium wynnwilliamsii]TXD88510.1 uracil-DNA glycosylase family protein [Subsaximicrobium wynnwilliamsii]TXE02494.1 uracil-DNA glycosylase family protein [Subsaximicrobium wynnwilliamsii]
MFFHKHPYSPFIQLDSKKLIVGTLPPPRFTTGDLLEKDVDFCYGSCYNSLWLFIDEIYELDLRYDNSDTAVQQRKQFLVKHKIGVCDIVESAEREKIDASDLGMNNIALRDIMAYLKKFPNIETLIFTGGNSKNGPEYFFRKHLKTYDLKLRLVSNEVPRIHEFIMPAQNLSNPTQLRTIKTVSLSSSSGAANISISRMPLYKQLKAKNPDFNTFDFRVMQYREFL